MARLVIFLFGMWVGTVSSSAVDLQRRIIGGQTCADADRQYHVHLRFTNGTHSTFCGGSLIGNGWIVTAAHCYDAGWCIGVWVHLDAHPHFPGRQLYIDNVAGIHRYADSDLLLLELPTGTVVNNTIGLPDCQNCPQVGTSVQIAGRGSNRSGPNQERQPGFTQDLQCANVSVTNCNTNQEFYAKGTFYSSRVFQAQSPGVDACKGDSGGGAVYNKSIYGVISTVHDGDYTCRGPVTFVNLCYWQYLDWIERTTGLIAPRAPPPRAIPPRATPRKSWLRRLCCCC